MNLIIVVKIRTIIVVNLRGGIKISKSWYGEIGPN